MRPLVMVSIGFHTRGAARFRMVVGACLLLAGAVLGGRRLAAEEAAEPTAASVLAALQEIEAEAARIQPQTPLQVHAGPLAIQVREIFQGVTNSYSNDAIRFCAVELTAVNTSPEPQSLAVQGIRLRSRGKSLSWKDRSPALDGLSFLAGRESRTIRDVQPPDALAIPGGAAASVWLVFSGLELGSLIPDLALEIPAQPQPLLLDVNLYERALLKLAVRQTGPADCLAILTIKGRLNTVNAGALSDELDRLATAGVHRAVVAIDPQAPPPGQTLTDWLKQAHQPNPYQQQFRHMPVFPVTLSELQLVLPESLGGQVDAHVHTELQPAVSEALQTAFAAVGPEEVIRALRSSEAEVRAAALEHGAARLRPEQFELVLRFVSAPEPAVRKAALVALGQFAAPQAIAALAEAASSSDRGIADAAIHSLAASRFPEAHAALADLIRSRKLAPQEDVISILSAHPRPAWLPTLRELTTSSSTKVQQAALQALARLGDAQLLPILRDSLRSTEPRVREEAFQQLARLDTREADELALEYALERLRSEPPSASIRQFIERVRDQRAIPLLLRYLDEPEAVRRGVIELLAAIGDQSVADELVRRFGTFSDSEKILALQAFVSLDSPLGKSLAIAGLKSDDFSLTQRAVDYLKQLGTDDAVAAMAEAVRSLGRKSNEARSSISYICNGIGGIATPAARQALWELRSSTDEVTRGAAQLGLLVYWNQSPARDLLANAESEIRTAEFCRRKGSRGQPVPVTGGTPLSPDQALEQADRLLASAGRLLESAERIDPLHPELALERGLLQELQGETDPAIASFRRAIELNPDLVEAHIELGNALYAAGRFADALEPLQFAFDNDPDERRHQWLTSRALALMRLGRMEEAIALVQEHAKEFPNVPIFEYNVACLYGRAVEQLRIDPDVPEDDPRLAVFSEEAVQSLEASFEHGVETKTDDPDMWAYMREDSDLAPLHNVSIFRRFAQLDLPPEQRKKTPPRPPQPEDAPLR